MASSDARPIPRKNTAFRVTFDILDADGDLVSGATGLDSEVSLDGAEFADCTNEATEIATSSGMYYLDLTADEMNADTVAIIVKTSTSGAKTTPIVLYPEELGDIRVSSSGVGATSQTVNVTVGGNVEDGVEVWVTTDSAGANVVASGVTDALGNVIFLLDAGTYYVWKQLAGANFTNPETMVVS